MIRGSPAVAGTSRIRASAQNCRVCSAATLVKRDCWPPRARQPRTPRDPSGLSETNSLNQAPNAPPRHSTNLSPANSCKVDKRQTACNRDGRQTSDRRHHTTRPAVSRVSSAESVELHLKVSRLVHIHTRPLNDEPLLRMGSVQGPLQHTKAPCQLRRSGDHLRRPAVRYNPRPCSFR